MSSGYFVLRQEILTISTGRRPVLGRSIVMTERRWCRSSTTALDSMDTYKEKQQLDDLYARGQTPWCVWRTSRSHSGESPAPWRSNCSTAFDKVETVLASGRADDIEIGCGGTLLALSRGQGSGALGGARRRRRAGG
jgi:hypothetical protein